MTIRLWSRCAPLALLASLFATTFVPAPWLSAAGPLEQPASKPPAPKQASPPRRMPLTEEERKQQVERLALAQRIALGKKLFNHEWQTAVPANGAGDGLGPLFNERSCVACHNRGGVGGAGCGSANVQLIVAQRMPATDKWETTHAAQREYVLPTATGDTFLLHRFGNVPGYEAWRQERLSLVSGKPDFAVSDAARVEHLVQVGLDLKSHAVQTSQGLIYGTRMVVEQPTLVKFVKEERNTTALFGAGLIDKVKEETLTEIAAAQSKEIRGRVPRTGDRRLGRFGWKGQNETLLEFNEGACAAELGLETGKNRQAKAPVLFASAKSKANTFNIPLGIDITPQEIQAMSDYVASLPAPVKVAAKSKIVDVLAGERKFFEIGCAGCHTQQVGNIDGLYSDLLLHRVGLTGFGTTYYGAFVEKPLDVVEGLDPKRTADPDEFRTPPLWGVADSAPYLHDGRARTLHEAITAHGGQARDSSFAYSQLHDVEQKQIVGFLGQLRAPKPGR